MISEKANIEIEQVSESRLAEADLDNPGFGRIFADHMFEMEYRDGSWHSPTIKPYGTIEVEPALKVFHYGQSVFEGTKAYYVGDDTVNLFRPEKNIERMTQSCRRICIPPVPPDLFLQAIEQLIKLDHRWVPQKEGNALYIRPFASAFEPVIAASSADVFRFYIITSPVGSYYSKPVKLLADQHHVRAARGGTGATKTAGNYAASLYPVQQAKDKGFDQVLWLDAIEHKYVEEVGTMNIFFLIDDLLVTPKLSGTILPGVTRDSVIQLARHWDVEVEERAVSIDEVMEAGKQGKLREAFGTGTAAVVAPVNTISYNGETVTIHEEERGALGQRLYDEIYGIQTGKKEDPFGWIYPVTVHS
ncbi:branched-chain amino acid aminotransferase [Aliifodinibius sp. S!AR15-10]|uniref:branched-chain amino acid aminotransferase n=1 Tax=Aliifodinibius sp. S!AR15-10 TaxID=2950437 RepID=UPI0028554786|nr:branched-chain amino acid aminotransferase [Aliifodinibius sp. S!AR15-10]MDR8391666.1 branched-chain amino acid aminotransferase [Aliifodinibius sp. S!AR15-10]